MSPHGKSQVRVRKVSPPIPYTLRARPKPRYQNFTNNFPTHISLCNRPPECCHHKISPLSFIIQSFRHSRHFSVRSNRSAQVYSNWPRRDLFIFVANKYEIPPRGYGVGIPGVRASGQLLRFLGVFWRIPQESLFNYDRMILFIWTTKCIPLTAQLKNHLALLRVVPIQYSPSDVCIIKPRKFHCYTFTIHLQI